MLSEVPDKAGECSSDRSAGFVLIHATGGKASVSLTESQLRSPGDVAQGSGQSLLADVHLSADPRWVGMAPGRLNRDSSRMSAASMGDAALGAALTARILARYQAEKGHELLGVGKSAQVSELGDQSERRDEVDTAQAPLLSDTEIVSWGP